ncbi:hypothetical protein [Pseudomonas sp. P8_241]|jgi:hypothetical protein|uniref:hypothetical protein n=1 Tax=Pseudomonas sp. P8_241 TaxID=3043445 RepID=UPI002A36562C|nr:hypothetical protein [Pseudomonas sp. P8_241]WPN45924.1 hypothetical protein QMK58_22590 [Pseudomonas sp. P8_241]
MPEIKERPILFSAPMVRAILEGRKTVTRRALNEQALKNIGYGVQLGECHELPAEGPLHPNSVGYYNDFCPYGQPGDQLWVRETWYCDHFEVERGPYLQPADLADLDQAREDGELVYAADGLTPYEQDQPTWKPSIHMPRWVSRILLEITDVRLERLQDISEEQAQAEGIVGVAFRPDDGWPICTGYMVGPDDGKTGLQTTAAKAFAGLWDSVGGDWDANPWVWVVEFKQVTP